MKISEYTLLNQTVL